MNNAELSAYAEALGHTAPAVHGKANGRWYGTCSCGYTSTTRTTMRLAADALVHHVHKVVREARAQGFTLPRRDTPKIAEPVTRTKVNL